MAQQQLAFFCSSSIVFVEAIFHLFCRRHFFWGALRAGAAVASLMQSRIDKLCREGSVSRRDGDVSSTKCYTEQQLDFKAAKKRRCTNDCGEAMLCFGTPRAGEKGVSLPDKFNETTRQQWKNELCGKKWRGMSAVPKKTHGFIHLSQSRCYENFAIKLLTCLD